MQATLSAKGQVQLPSAARRRLRANSGARLSVELRDGGVLLRPLVRSRRYKLAAHPVSGLPIMTALERPARKVTAAGIARLHAELL
ncbi:MAG: AbrB/MazE/SpoVT family DNA-binding domain-containing protein [Verrucomicrobia bacterium]|nr:AbrB/MazE/SpoVT family DNA-binding domain-containing protein [Verrucomicrobiota bacterium]